MVQTFVSGKRLVTLILGDGVGPEVVRPARRVVEAAGGAGCVAGVRGRRGSLPPQASLGRPGRDDRVDRERRVVLKRPRS